MGCACWCGWSWCCVGAAWACGVGGGGVGAGHGGEAAGAVFVMSGCVVWWLCSSAGGDVGLGGVQVGQNSGIMCPWGQVVGGWGRSCVSGKSCVVLCRGFLCALSSSRVTEGARFVVRGIEMAVGVAGVGLFVGVVVVVVVVGRFLKACVFVAVGGVVLLS